MSGIALLAAESARAGRIEGCVRDGLAALAATPAASDAALARELRRDARRARGLQGAASRPVSVAVFGASQAGKSYLVSRLAAPVGRSLIVDLGGARLDFLKEINPPGGEESTGIVTRFTVRVPPAVAGGPVTLRFFTQTDVVKIIANTFLEDFLEGSTITIPIEAQAAHLAALEPLAGPAERDGLTADDVEDLGDYFARFFRGRALVEGLTANFWSRLAQIAPRLPAEERARAFSPLWAGTEALTTLCRTLILALRDVGFAEEVRAGLDAIQPVETSIVDVKTLRTIGTPDAGTIALRDARGGAPVAVQRGVVTALVAEMVAPLAEKPWPFLEHTDLLDFPGARSREQIENAPVFLSDPKRLGEAFLRGKVAFLFQRYNAEQEVSAMLLCVGPSNQEVKTLPRMVDEWIGLSVGPTPAERRGRPNALFFILTKFDTEFEEKQGEDVASGGRWSTRLRASLLDPFGKSHGWPAEWEPGKPFDNVFWLRNPAIGFAAVFDYGPKPADAPAPETGVAPRAEAMVRERRDAYLANDLVRRHFTDPARSWEEALRPNDGGITHLAAALQPVCDTSLKARQLAARARTLATAAASRLRPFFHGGDAEERARRARERARALAPHLLACAQAQMLGPLLRAMMVTTDSVAAAYWRQQSDASTGVTRLGTAGSGDDYRALLGDLLGDAPAGGGPRDAYEQFAALVIDDWAGRARAVAEDEAAPAAFHVPAEALLEIATELVLAARRTNLVGQVAEALRTRAGFQGRADATSAKQVAIAEEMVNDFVYRQGWNHVPEERRPRRPGDDRPIFRPRPREEAPPALPERPVAYDTTFYAEWILGLNRLMADNAASEDGQEYDLEANARLGAALRGLDEAAGGRA